VQQTRKVQRRRNILPRAEIQKKKKRKKERDLRNSNFKAFTESSLRINQEYRTKK
jgi:hypothetical protein